MAAAETSGAGRRLPPRPGEGIDRSAPFTFQFDGREIAAFPGDTIASAMAAGGVKVFSRSFKYHRPRGLLCCSGHCPNCMVRVGDEPNVRACREPAAPGLRVTHQNAWPSLDADVMSLTELGGRFLPVGFYYKTFIHPRALWPVYEAFLRRAAGLGVLDTRESAALPAHSYKEYLHAEVVVVGGGPAGLSAALAAAESGARVLLLDDQPQLGGHLRYSADSGPLAELTAAAAVQPNLTVLTGATVLGWYEDNWLAAQQGGQLLKIRTQAMVVATGAYEQPLVFDHNDLPGVMLGSAAQRLVRLHGVAPGRKALIVTANDDGWQVAADMLAAGVGVAAIVDERARDDCASPHRDRLAGETPVFWKHTIAAALGSGRVSGARVARVDDGPGGIPVAGVRRHPDERGLGAGRRARLPGRREAGI